MIWNPFKSFADTCLGIDIGAFSVKLAEVKHGGKQKELTNYGEVKIGDIYSGPVKDISSIEAEEIGGIISAVIKEAGMKNKRAVVSLPDYHTFFTTFTLPPMTKEEMTEAVKFEAPVRIPLPISKVSLDWQVVEGLGKEEEAIRILLVAIPTEVLNKYQEIVSAAKLDLFTFEAEAFSLMRTLVKDEKTAAIADIGAESTTCSIVDKRIIRASHSFDTGGKKFTSAISKSLEIDTKEAEKIKKEEGVLGEEKVKSALLPLIDLIVEEIRRASENFYDEEKKKIEKIILTGGTSLMPGLKEYMESNLAIAVEIGNPFSGISYPQELNGKIKKMSPLYATALGAGMRGLK